MHFVIASTSSASHGNTYHSEVADTIFHDRSRLSSRLSSQGMRRGIKFSEGYNGLGPLGLVFQLIRFRRPTRFVTYELQHVEGSAQ